MTSYQDDSATKEVLDYYEKYSQNSNLPKYFSGASVPYLLGIPVSMKNNDGNTMKVNAVPKTSVYYGSLLDCDRKKSPNKDMSNKSSQDSPLESPSDNKKLEWDSGADIGYNIFQTNAEKKSLRKCLSLPVLENFDDVKLTCNAPNLTPILGSGNVNVFIVTSTSGSTISNRELTDNSSIASDITDNHSKQVFGFDCVSSSSAERTKSKLSQESSGHSESKLLDFKMTLSYLKEKVGLPDAHSSPNVIHYIKSRGSDLRKSVGGCTSKNLNKKGEIACKEVKSVSDLVCNISSVPLLPQVLKNDVKLQMNNQPSLSNSGSISITNMTENLSKEPKQPNKKVIELSLSTPISIDWGCSEVVDKDKLVGLCEVKPKVVQTESIFELGLQSNVDQLKAADKCQPSFYSKHETDNILPDYASNCDSFEYVSSSSAFIRAVKDKEQLPSPISGSKNDLFNIDNSKCSNISHKIFNGDSHKNTNLRSSVTKSVAEVIQKHVQLLQKLLSSKKIHLRTKKNYIKKIIKEVTDFQCVDHSNTSSELFLLKNDTEKGKPKFKHELISEQVTNELSNSSKSKKQKQISVTEILQKENVLDNCQNNLQNITPIQEVNLYSNSVLHGPVELPSVSDNKFESGLDCTIVNQESTKSIRYNTFQKYKTSSEATFAYWKKDKTHSEYLAQKQKERDYLLKFAENERAFQIGWIDTEISHLTKLKNILELKDSQSCPRRDMNKTPSQKNQFKKSVYRIIQKDEINENSKRDYVIQTKLDVSTDDKVNYYLEGKKYFISDCKISHTDTKSSEEFVKNSVVAGIKIQSEQNETNIKITTLCHICKQVTCVCQSGLPGNNTQTEINLSTLDRCKDVPKMRCNCKDVKSICKEGEKARPGIDTRYCNDSSSTLIEECIEKSNELHQTVFQTHLPRSKASDAHEQSNSLQRIFERCCCTIESRKCSCIFVKKLFHHLMPKKVENLKDVSSDVGLIFKDSESQTSPFLKHGFYDDGSQANFADNNFNLQTSTDVLHLDLVNTPQTKDIVKEPEIKQFINLSEHANHKKKSNTKNGINAEEHLFISQNKSNTKTVTSENIKQKITYMDAINHSNVKSKESALPDIRQIDHSTLAMFRPSIHERPLKVQTVVREIIPLEKKQNEFITDDSHLNFTSVNDTKYKKVGVQASVDFKNHSTQTSVVVLHKKNQTIGKKSCFEKKLNYAHKKINVHPKNCSTNSLLTQKDSQIGPKPYKNLYIRNDKNVTNITPEVMCSELLKHVDVHSGTQLTSKDGAISDGTFANYSQSGSTSACISTSVFDSCSTPSSRLTCIYCKKKAFVAEVNYVRDRNTSYAVCSRCYYNKPTYSVNDSQLKYRYIKLLESGYTSTSDQFCKCELKLNRKGVAYTLTLNEPAPTKSKKQVEKPDFEDITFHKPADRKSVKNKDNCHKKKYLYTDLSENDKYKKLFNKDHDMSRPKSPKESTNQYTLTDYLVINRPEFIYSAEYRRQMVLNSRILREQQRDVLKLHFLENNLNSIADVGQYKLFTEREMKEINNKIYQKLPEVRMKLTNIREKRLRYADKLISGIFAKKVQRSVLEGKRNFPIDKPLTNMYK